MKARKMLIFRGIFYKTQWAWNLEGCQINLNNVNFHLQKSLLIRIQLTKSNPKRTRRKKYHPSCQLGLWGQPIKLIQVVSNHIFLKYGVSGPMSSGHLSFKRVTLAGLNSLRQKRCLNFNMVCHDSTKRIFFWSIKKNAEFKNLDDS